MKTYGDIDSKFRFVILASKRAKQLLKGSKPKIKSKSKNLIRIAQDEVKRGIVDYEISQPTEEKFHKPEDEVFIGEVIGEQDVDAVDSEKDEKTEDKSKRDVKAKPKEKKKKKKK